MFSVNPKCSPSILANFRDSVKDLHLLRSLNDVETSIRISCRAHTLGRSPPPVLRDRVPFTENTKENKSTLKI